jgi:hypothetical protein
MHPSGVPAKSRRPSRLRYLSTPELGEPGASRRTELSMGGVAESLPPTSVEKFRLVVGTVFSVAASNVREVVSLAM